MFNWIYFGILWALSGAAGWKLRVKMYSGNRATGYDWAMFVPSLAIGPVNLLFAIMYGK